MSDLIIFILGVVVTGMVVVGVVLMGLNEASDPNQSRPEDLAEWERDAVAKDRDDLET